MRYRSLLLLSVGALLAAYGAGYSYNPQQIDCNVPPYYSVCAWSSS